MPIVYTLQHIKLNIFKFIKKIKDKGLEPNFWIIVDRSDFKPLKKITTRNKIVYKHVIHSINEIVENYDNYKNKKFAEIKIKFHDNIIKICDDIKSYKKIKTKPIITIHVTIYPTDENGRMLLLNKKEIKVNYYVDDFKHMMFKLKNIEIITRLLGDNAICKNNSFLEISYRDLIKS